MRLTNSQYDTIMRAYDEKRSLVNNALEQRKSQIFKEIPEYEALSIRSGEISRQAAFKSIMNGDKKAVDRLKAELADISQKKLELLSRAGYSSDYLEPHYECSLCKDTGFINGKKCRCFLQASIDLLYNQSNLKKILGLENFSNFNYYLYSESPVDDTSVSPRENITNIVDNAKKFIDAFPSGQNMLFMGDTGVGKTYLTHCIAKELLDKGFSVLYLTSVDLFDIFSKYTFDYSSEADYKEAFSQILDCDLLIIDDLGTESINSFTNSKLFYCINERLASGVSTLISTNLDLRGIMNTYSERIFSRIRMSYSAYRIIGEDIRLLRR